MAAPTKDDFSHWGMACYCFSLDLSQAILSLALPAVPFESIRQACRDAIMANRDAIAATGRPEYLRDLVAQHWRGQGHAAFNLYVERTFVSAARRQNKDLPLLRPLSDAARLTALDTALEESLDGKTYAASVYGQIDPDLSQRFFDVVYASDSAVDGQELSDWDNALIARNAEVHSPDAPLVLPFHTQMRVMEQAAAQSLYDALNADARHHIDKACEAPLHG